MNTITLEQAIQVQKTSNSFFEPLSKRKILGQLSAARKGKYEDAGVVLERLRTKHGF